MRHQQPSRSAPVRRPVLAGVLIASVGCAMLAGCRRQPAISAEAYREAVVAFYTGLAALQTSQEVLARQQLERVIGLAPHEPSAWANIGLLLLRQQDLDGAAERLTKAAQLAPDNADIQRLLGLMESRRGNLAEAIRHWQRALQLRPGDIKAAYALAIDQERLGSPESIADAQRTLESLSGRTGNLVVRLDYARIAAKRGDRVAMQRAVQELTGQANSWPDDIRERFRAVEESAAAANPQATGQNIAFLRNVAMRLPEYRQSYAAVSTPQAEVGEPLDRLLALANPPPQPSPVDSTLAFGVQAEPGLPAKPDAWIGAIHLGQDTHPVVAISDGSSIQVSGGLAWATPGRAAPGPSPATSGRRPVLAADLNYDFLIDLAIYGARGLELLRQKQDGTFTSVTAETRLPASVLTAAAAGLWAADVDTDGDLDIVEALVEGPLRVLRNNGDGTFTVQEPFASAVRTRGFVWADLDGDGVPDATVLDAAGSTRVYLNARGGSFRERPVPATFPKAVAVAAAEVTGDAIIDLLALTSAGTFVTLSQPEDQSAWTTTEFARMSSAPAGLSVGAAGLLVADLDNNGAADIIVAGSSATYVLLRGPERTTRPLDRPLALEVRAAEDMDGDGRLELIGVQPDGKPAIARSTGERRYHWQSIRTHAATSTGDQRINSFGIGGEVEVRTGLHLQKQPITSPIVHVGLGEAGRSEVVRITWPNGTLQSEFNAAADASIAANQRLKGSCPWLFAWNGQSMAFVTDVLWRSPLGLRINAQATADVVMTEDWVKLRGDQLQPRDGFYDLRITAELWETHFFDLATLLVVDHPPDTDVFVDERFAIPAPEPGIVVTSRVQPVAAAHDDTGRDVAALVRERDDRYLDSAGRGRYQGVTRDHFVEIEIPESAPRTGPLWLIAQGWIHPTDSSINVALGQGTHPRPRGLTLETADAAGRFRTARADLGFPAGKNKTILIDLNGVFPKTGRRRARLSTNMEIFWDRLGWAAGRADAAIARRRIVPASADLRYRGYSATEQPDPSSPELPRYALEGTTPRWRDLAGYYTRFGDVRELLLAVDDRYVIMNAGDELVLRFPESPPPSANAVRDFVMITDGWEKDGDFNTAFSGTVLPLPTHASARYDRRPGRLEDDPVYQRHADDFVKYHTRYVSANAVRDALRRPRDPE